MRYNLLYLIIYATILPNWGCRSVILTKPFRIMIPSISSYCIWRRLINRKCSLFCTKKNYGVTMIRQTKRGLQCIFNSRRRQITISKPKPTRSFVDIWKTLYSRVQWEKYWITTIIQLGRPIWYRDNKKNYEADFVFTIILYRRRVY